VPEIGKDVSATFNVIAFCHGYFSCSFDFARGRLGLDVLFRNHVVAAWRQAVAAARRYPTHRKKRDDRATRLNRADTKVVAFGEAEAPSA